MAVRKKRVLVCSESPSIPTGYGVMSKNILERLAGTGKFDVTLLCSEGTYGDPAHFDLPYRVVHNLPNPSDPDEVAAYDANPLNSQGLFRCDETCLAVKPDAVLSWKDLTADFFLDASPLRPFYRLALCATVDAEPQPDEAGALYGRCDAALTYTRWGAGVLGRLGVTVAAQAPPVADFGCFTPVSDRAALRRSLGIADDALIVGSIMRCQPRKRFPELIEAFRLLCEAAPVHLRERFVLYLHTGYPDTGWDLPRLLRDAGVLRRTFFTYSCAACRCWYPSRYEGPRSVCRRCGAGAANPSSVSRGLADADLARVYNLFDVFAQVSACEGLGVPQLEAVGCGVPLVTVDYSAMAEVARAVGGVAVPPAAFTVEAHSHRKLAVPDAAGTARALLEILRLPAASRAALGFRQRVAAQATYSWDKTAAAWERVLDALPAPELSWDAPPRRFGVDDAGPAADDYEFARRLVRGATGRTDLELAEQRVARDLAAGLTKGWLGGVFGTPADLGSHGWTRYDRAAARAEARRTADLHTHWDGRRTAKRSTPQAFRGCRG